jgi:hypothetical protein
VATYVDYGGVRRWSLRSEDHHADVSRIARRFGGRGQLRRRVLTPRYKEAPLK